MRCNPQTQHDLQELKTEVQGQQQEHAPEQPQAWEIFHQVNEGWHQYLIRDPQRMISLAYHAAHKRAEFTIDPNMIRIPYDEDLEIARHTLEGQTYVVISARGPYSGAGVALAADGYPPHTFHIGDAVPSPTEQADAARDKAVQERIQKLRSFIASEKEQNNLQQAALLLEALALAQELSQAQRQEIAALRQEYERLKNPQGQMPATPQEPQ